MVDFAKLMQQKATEKTQLPQQPKVNLIIPGKSNPIVPTASSPEVMVSPDPKSALAPVAASTPATGAPISAEQFQYKTQPDLMGKDDAEQFKVNLNMLRESFMHKDLIAPVIRRILVDLDSHPEFEEFLAPEDCGLMVRMLRQSYGIMVQVAQGKKRNKKPEKELSVGIGDLAAMTVDL